VTKTPTPFFRRFTVKWREKESANQKNSTERISWQQSGRRCETQLTHIESEMLGWLNIKCPHSPLRRVIFGEMAGRSNPPCASNAIANNSFICFSRNTFVTSLTA
jgi:hypothetical protein